MFSCCSRVLSGTQKEKAREEAERREEKKKGDKPNYLLRIWKKCVINCSGPEEGWRFLSEPVGLRMRGDKAALLFTVFNWG